MSEQSLQHTEPKEIGAEAIRALTSMNIPPKPEYYEVWFSHLEKNNEDLSSEIEKKIECDERVDEFFLKAIHERYFEIAHPAKVVEKIAVDALTETNSLKELSDTFSSNTQKFGADLAQASQQAVEDEDAPGSATRLMAALVDAAQEAITRNQRLEKDLSTATIKIQKLQSSIEVIAKDASTDFLTGLNNRRHFDSMAPKLVDAAHSEEAPLCLIVADIDLFKQFNDKWGHPVGDQVLKLVADVLRENIKGQDLLSRYGGEEFVIALPNTSIEDATKLAENIRIAVSRRKLVNRANNKNLGRVTMSFGVSQLRSDETATSLYKSADGALYEAKETGRNKVVCHSRVGAFA